MQQSGGSLNPAVLPPSSTASAPPPPAKPAAAEAPASESHLNLIVRGQNGEAVHFKIKKTTPLSKLMNSYCERQGLAANACRFLFDGKRLHGESTAADVGMEDNDIIDSMIEQTGGQ